MSAAMSAIGGYKRTLSDKYFTCLMIGPTRSRRPIFYDQPLILRMSFYREETDIGETCCDGTRGIDWPPKNR